MRIIAGEWRGRPLHAPPGATTRPTADRTREALFSMLTSRVGSFEGLRVLDLFAGTGALGLEALSRGAAACTFVEIDRIAIEAIHANIRTFDAAVRCIVCQQSAAEPVRASQPFDLIFADPPYGTGLGHRALDRYAAAGALAPSGWACLETADDERGDVEGLTLETERVYGRARISLLRLA